MDDTSPNNIDKLDVGPLRDEREKMFKPLPWEANEALDPSGSSPKPDLIPIVPVPEDAPPLDYRHPDLGEPTTVYKYLDEGRRLLGYVYRWDFTNADGEPDKEFRPITFCELEDDRREWRSKGFPEPRPLYGLDLLAARPDAEVILVEGEKTADAGQQLLPDKVVVTWPGGTKSVSKVDFSPLGGRTVTILPDNDEPGVIRARTTCIGRYFC